MRRKLHANYTLKRWQVAIIVAVVGALGYATTALAIDTSSAFYTSNITILNLGLTRQNFAAATEISGASLIDDAFMAADTLNSAITSGPTEIPSMPPNNRIVVQDCVVDDGGSFTDWQSECQDSTELDFPLLPAVPVVDDAAYFACDNPCRIITVNVGQEAVADSLSLTWEYYNGTAFVTASNVSDLTQSFTRAGQRAVSFDMPSDMATTTLTGSAVGDTYWVRARVTDVDSPTQQALGNQAWYENGQWWAWAQSQSINQQLLYSLNVGGADLVTNHQIFPGSAGIITPDDASIELGDEYNIHFEGSINFTAGVTGSNVCIVCKDGALALWISDTDAITLDVTGSGTTSLTLDGIPDATSLPITTAPHIVDVISDGTDLTLTVNNVGSVTGAAQTVTDTANDWEWGSNQGFVFANLIYILPDATGLAFELFDTQAEWDTGTKTDTQSQGGQPDFEYNLLPDTGVDDGFWVEGSGDFFNALTDVRFGYSGAGAQTSVNAFVRFNNVPIEQGETITAANLRFDPFTTESATTVNVEISAIDEDDASAPSTFAAAEAASRTTAFTDWNSVPTFTLGTFQDSPDIASVIQEIIDRPGWESGNAIVIYIEDNGSTAAASRWRRVCAFEGTCGSDGVPVKLQLTTADAPTTFSDDFIELESFTDDGNAIPGWAVTCGGCREARATTDEAEHYGKYAMDLDEGTSIGTTASATQVITGVNPGEVWSFGVSAIHTSTNDDTARMVINFQDSGGSTLSTSTTVIGTAAALQTITDSGLTAPANTAQIQIILSNTCDDSPFTCTSSGTDLWVDGMIACISPSAPTFPDSCNRVENPSFENIYVDTGNWVTPTINLTQTDVGSSQIAWDAYAPFDGTITVETSLDNQATWSTATNGESIPGISVGDDLTGGTLHVRVTFTPGTPTTLEEITFSPFMSTLALVILDDQSEANTDLFYQLRTTPGVTIEDLSPNSNDGTMSYPVQLTGIFSAISPLQSNRTPLSQQGALGAGDFTSPATGSQTDINIVGGNEGADLPLGGLGQVVKGLGYPIEFWWAFLILFLGIGLAGIVYVWGNQNEWLASGVLAGTVVLATAIGDGLIPGWVPFVMILMLVSYNILRSRLPI